MIDCCH